jgi:hypothetical protein
LGLRVFSDEVDSTRALRDRVAIAKLYKFLILPYFLSTNRYPLRRKGELRAGHPVALGLEDGLGGLAVIVVAQHGCSLQE